MELVSACQDCGFDHIQLALLPLLQQSAWSGCGEFLRDSGITVLSGMFEASGEDYSTLETIAKTGGLRKDSMWSSTEENAIQVADIATQMQIPLVTFHAGFIPEDDCIERTTMLNRLRTLADIFGSSGIKLGLETGQERAKNVVCLLEELSHPLLGVNFDPANMILYGRGNPLEAIQMLAPWVMQVHIKDAIPSKTKGEWGTEVPVGEGEVDWLTFLKCVPDEVNLVIERESGEDRVQDIQRAKKMLERIDVC